MPAVTRSMAAQSAKNATDMDTDNVSETNESPPEISRSKARTKRPRKRFRSNTIPDDLEPENPKKRRRVQNQDVPGKKKRSRVIRAVSKSDKSTELSDEESLRIQSMQQMERKLYEERNYHYVVGCDEAGRGPLAGPVVAAACYIPLEVQIAQLTDSKALTEEQREEIFEELMNNDRVVYGVSTVSHTKIDEINILQAALLGMREACVELNDKLLKKSGRQKPAAESSCENGVDEKQREDSDRGGAVDYILVDGNRDPKFEQCEERGLTAASETIVKGDARVYCIAAASIIAKVTRDRLMVEYDKQFPVYNFAQHKGYPTPQHKALVHEHGPCEIHRRSFQPIRGIVGWEKPKPKKPKGGRRKKSKNVQKKSG